MRALRVALGVLLATGLTACGTHADAVCETVGDCAHSGSTDWIAGCRAEADLLKHECQRTGCITQWDAYFTCADGKGVCSGNTPSFPDCQTRRDELDACLAHAEAGTSCADLKQAVSVCPGFDAGGVPPACTAQRSCEARCLLSSVQNVCSPQVPELDDYTTCVKQCP